jgi:hypothetical protein
MEDMMVEGHLQKVLDEDVWAAQPRHTAATTLEEIDAAIEERDRFRAALEKITRTDSTPKAIAIALYALRDPKK